MENVDPQMLGDEIKKQLQDEYRKYRESGFKLMTTVIALSGGSVVGLYKEIGPHLASYFLLFPIVTALFQQLFQYLGEMYAARATFAFYQFEIGAKGLDEQGTGKLKAEFYQMSKKSNWWYGRADVLCWIAVLVFVFAALFSLSVLMVRVPGSITPK